MPFVDQAPDREPAEIERGNWRSGELQGLYHDWLFHKMKKSFLTAAAAACRISIVWTY